MKTLTTADLRKHIAKTLRLVEATKKSVQITRYGRVIATIVPVQK